MSVIFLTFNSFFNICSFCVLVSGPDKNRRDENSGAKLSEQSNVYLNEFFCFDPMSNKTKDLVFNSSAIMTNQVFWKEVQNGLYSAFGSAASVMLFQMGISYGFSVGSKARLARKDVYEASKFLEMYGLMAGWGKFKTSPLTLKMGRLTEPVKVSVTDNFFGLCYKDRVEDTPKCFIIAGILAGIAEGLLGEGHSCTETRCIAKGDQHCEFIIRPRETVSY